MAPTNSNDGGDTDRKLQVFVIDTGWKTPIRQTVLDNLGVFRQYLHARDHEVFVLSQEQSVALLRTMPQLIHSDPILLFLEPPPADGVPGEGRDRGVSLNLGHATSPKQVAQMMRWMAELMCSRVAVGHLREVVSRTAHKEGFRGAVKIIVDTAVKALPTE
jgi:hypothetical protein